MELTFTSMSKLFEQLVVYCNQINDLIPNKKLFVSFNKSFFSPLNRYYLYQRHKASFCYLTDLYSKFDVVPVCRCFYKDSSSLDVFFKFDFLVKVTEE